MINVVLFRLVDDRRYSDNIPAVHRLPHLLDTSVAPPPPHLQIHPQGPPQVEGADTVCEPRLPPDRWLPTERPVSSLRLLLPDAQVHVSHPLPVCQHLDGVDPRR